MRKGGRQFILALNKWKVGYFRCKWNACLHTVFLPSRVAGIIALESKAITDAVEFYEDDIKKGWKDL